MVADLIIGFSPSVIETFVVIRKGLLVWMILRKLVIIDQVRLNW
jgi:hypothetical protein